MQGGPEAEARSQDLAVSVRDESVHHTATPVSTHLGHRGLDVRPDIAGVDLSEPPAVMLEMGAKGRREDAALFDQDSADPRWPSR